MYKARLFRHFRRVKIMDTNIDGVDILDRVDVDILEVVLKKCDHECPAYSKLMFGERCILYKKEIKFEFYADSEYEYDGFPNFCTLPVIIVSEIIRKKEI